MAKKTTKTATKAAEKKTTRPKVASGLATYIVQRSYCRNRPGSRIDLDATTAAPLVRDGIVIPAGQDTSQ